MAQWKKLLKRMATDTDPRNYAYADAVKVLSRLGFELAPVSGTSHRKWRRRLDDGTAVVIGLVDKGSGTLKPHLIRAMVQQLQEHRLMPGDEESE